MPPHDANLSLFCSRSVQSPPDSDAVSAKPPPAVVGPKLARVAAAPKLAPVRR